MKGENMGFFEKLKQGMNKTKSSFDEKINNVFKSFRKVDEEFLDELEEVLIMSDIGVETSVKIISNLRNRIKKDKIQDEEDVKKALREEMKKILDVTDINLHLNTKPSVILVVGVNGVGKTTSIGKIANRLAKDGKKVVVAAADTFRAAAVEQLEIWANRAGADIVKREEGVDTASVKIVKQHFNAVVAENCMKHAIIHPEEDRYDFGQADEFVKFGEDKMECILPDTALLGIHNLHSGSAQTRMVRMFHPKFCNNG